MTSKFQAEEDYFQEESNLTDWRPKKRLGQNFLIDIAMAMNVASAIDLKGLKILEIGAGSGQITQYLCEYAKKGKVTALEIDKQLVEELKKKFGKNKNLLIKDTDALKFDFNGYDAIFGNLPYYISTPILFKILESDCKSAVLMVQEEFGKRLVATKGDSDFSRLTVSIQSVFQTEIIDYVPAESFDPAPKVASVVVKLLRKPENQQVKINSKLLRMAFCHKNKTLLNSLLSSRKELKKNREEIRNIAQKHLSEWKDVKIRQLSLEDWSNISKKYPLTS